MKKSLSTTIFFLLISVFAVHAQQKSMDQLLYKQVNDAIYRSFYNPEYMMRPVNTYTFFKVDVDENGKVTGTGFSDSADSVFVNAYYERQKKYNTQEYLQMFVTAKGYKAVALLIPVTFEAARPSDPAFKQPERLLQFNKKFFAGPAVMFPALYIKISPTNNM